MERELWPWRRQYTRTARPTARELTTICGFCGVGCGLSVKVEGGVITKVAGDKENPSSKGEACIKGREGWRHLYSDRRLTRPLIRKDGELVPASWDEALDLVAGKMSEIKEEYGPDSFGLFSSLALDQRAQLSGE